LYTKVLTITPALAVQWLDTKNAHNRPVSNSTVDRYAQEIKAGNWQLNGESIKFGKNGQILDGQHRLKAIVKANADIECLVVYGVENKTFNTIDDHNKRSLADVFAINGENNAKLLAIGTRFIWTYAMGQITTRDLRRIKIATKTLMQGTLDKNPGLRDSTKAYVLLRSRPGGLLIPAGMAIGLHHLFSLVDSKKAEEFFTKLQSGYDLTEGDPIATLRQSLITAKQQAAATIITKSAIFTYAVIAWNAYLRDERLTKLVFRSNSSIPEIDGMPKNKAKLLM